MAINYPGLGTGGSGGLSAAQVQALIDASPSAAVNPGTAAGRLTASSTEAVPSTSQTAKTSIYYRRYKGLFLALYTSSAWHLRSVPANTEIKITTGNITGTTTNGSPTITGISADDIEQLAVGMALTHGNFAGTPTISSMTSSTVTMSGNATADGTPTDLVFKVPADTNFGVFGYWDTDKIRFKKRLWTDSTWGAGTAGYTLADQDGAQVISGTPEELYLGLCRTTGTAGQTEFSFGSLAAGGGEAKLLGGNVYNQEWFEIFVGSTTDSYTYSTDAWRNAEASATMRASFVTATRAIANATYTAFCNTTVAGVPNLTSIGYNASTPGGSNGANQIGGNPLSIVAIRNETPSAGAHYLQAIESGGGSGTQGWYPDAGSPGKYQTGLSVLVRL